MALNQALKARLNPGPGPCGGFDAGDRVVATANHADAEPFGYANGEVGTVRRPRRQRGLPVAFPGGGPAIVPARPWATCCTAGRSPCTGPRARSGTRWSRCSPPEAAGMLSRPLVYTALTRAQRHLSVVHAAGPALARAVSTVGEPPRVTRLAALLAGE